MSQTRSQRWEELFGKGRRALEDARRGGDTAAAPLAEAVRHLTAALGLFPDRGAAYLERGVAHRIAAEHEMERRDDPSASFERALDDLDNAIRLGDGAEARVERGWAHGLVAIWQARSGQSPGASLEAALDDLAVALSKEPRSEAALEARAMLYTTLGRIMDHQGRDASALYERAASDWSGLARLTPENADTLAELAIVETKLALASLDRRADALARLERAVVSLLTATERRPEDAELWYLLGYVYLAVAKTKGAGAREGRDACDLAIDAFNHALALDPNRRDATFARGCARALLAGAGVGAGRSVALALEDLTRAVEQSPGHACVFYWRGRTLAAAGRLDEAIADLREAARLTPGDAAIRIELARALLGVASDRADECEARYREAAREIEAALAARPDDGRVFRLMGLAALAHGTGLPDGRSGERLGYIVAAAEHLTQAAALIPGDVEIRRELASTRALRVLLECAVGQVTAKSAYEFLEAYVHAARLGTADAGLRDLARSALERYAESSGSSAGVPTGDLASDPHVQELLSDKNSP